MNQQVMEVSPSVFSEIQQRAAEGAVEQMAFPKQYDRFAAWMHETFGAVYHTEYRVVVRWEWGASWKWGFPR